jgi:molecular chaperone GrpE (heat shock protein)
MTDPIAPKLSKWPFFLGDALLLGAAYFVFAQSQRPMEFKEVIGCVLCVALGAGCGMLPFLLEYRAVTKVVESGALTSVVAQIQNVQLLATQITEATSRWQTAQDAADKTADTARQIADGMAAEVKAFNEFMQRANEGEKATLRLETDKLRRAEADWLQIVVRILDHVYALNQAAARSRQPALIEQLGHFQNACREFVRRVGLTPFVAAPSDPFDEQRHQSADEETKPAAGALVDETVATGYTFQGKLLRPALVRLRKAGATEAAPVDSEQTKANAETTTAQSQLPLETAKQNSV